MAQYKVLQDIEAEDKLLGPLSLRQFIYAVIVVVLGFAGFKLGTYRWYLAFPFLPPMIFFGLLAAPFGRDQPSEVWLLAKIKFFLKTHKRVWDQAGAKELVTITVPKTIERVRTKGFSDQEVHSRLKALASTLDTRGWAVKNVDIATYQQPLIGSPASDRLVDISVVPQDASATAIDPSSDILDDQNNPLAQKVGQMIDASSTAHREELLNKVREAAADQKAVQQANGNQPIPEPKISSTIKEIMTEIEKQESQAQLAQANMRRLEPQAPKTTAAPAPQPTAQPQAQTAVTPPTDPGILRLVKNDDLNVATLGREANRKQDKDLPDDEVVISLR